MDLTAQEMDLSRRLGIALACCVAVAPACGNSAAQSRVDGSVGANVGGSPVAVDGGPIAAVDASPGAVDAGMPASCGPGASLCAGVCADLDNDAASCGRCGYDCGAGTCDGGRCVLSSLSAEIIALQVDDANIFFESYAGTELSIERLAKAGGTPSLLASISIASTPMVLGGESVYFADSAGIEVVPKQGGAPQALVPGHQPNTMAVGAQALYWSEVDGSQELWTTPLTNVAATELTTVTTGIGALSPAATQVFFAGTTGVSVVPIGGGTATTFFASAAPAQSLSLDAETLFFTQHDALGNAPQLWQVDLATKQGLPLADASSSPFGPLALDASAVYWRAPDFSFPPGSSAEGAIWRATKGVAASATKVVDALTGNSTLVAVDDTSLYFVDATVVGTSRILKAAKP